MKAHLCALSLVVMPGLIAETNPQQSQSGQTACCSTCSCNPCSCDPCCIPKPKKCIDCECYTPQYYDLQCDCGYFFDIEFLYWYGKEFKLPVALKAETIQVFPAFSLQDSHGLFVPSELTNMGSSWDPGYRIGVGYNSACDGWDYYVNYTYYHNNNSTSVSITSPGTLPPPINDKGLVSPWINTFINSVLPFVNVSFDFARGKWIFNYNMFDAEIGRKYWLSKCFNLRPFMGVRGGWIKINFNTDYDIILAQGVKDFIHYDIDFRNNFWGVGILGGFQPTWHFSQCFALYGLVDFALLWGDYQGRRKDSFEYQIDITMGPVDGHSREEECYDGMQGVFDLGLGFRWEDTWCCDKYRTTVDLGWEHHIWYNHVNRLQLIGTATNGNVLNPIFSFTSFVDKETSVVFGGLVARARFDF